MEILKFKTKNNNSDIVIRYWKILTDYNVFECIDEMNNHMKTSIDFCTDFRQAYCVKNHNHYNSVTTSELISNLVFSAERYFNLEYNQHSAIIYKQATIKHDQINNQICCQFKVIKTDMYNCNWTIRFKM